MDPFILNTLCGYPVTAICFCAITFMVVFKHRWLFAFGVSGALTLLRIVLYELNLGNINDIIQIPLSIIIIIFMSQGKVGYRLFAGAFIMLIMVPGEVLSNLMMTSLGQGISADSSYIIITNLGKFYIGRAVDLLMAGTLSYIAVLLWNRFVRNASQKSMISFVAFPLTQLLLIWYLCVLAAKTGGEMTDYIWIGSLTLASTAADAVMLVFMNRHKKLEDAQNRAEFLELQLAGQEKYYRQVMQSADETARIRHDLRNEIQTAYALMRNGDMTSAEKIFDGLADKVASPRFFCGSAVVNAVMGEKAELCREAGIELRSDISIGACPGISEMDMCSLFANVMDNAVNGCRESGAEKPYIEISAGKKKGFLALECVNSSGAGEAAPKPPHSPKDEHGWGLTILEDIAKRHDGRFESGPDGEVYRTSVFLKCE
jgi:hypothetical protein